jgi:hypothetical protein
MGFRDGEIKFSDLADSSLYKLAANGWDVNIASLIFKKILSIEKNKKI